MDERILVTYATIMGATTGIARAIGIELRASGAAVRVLPIDHVSRPENYRSIIIGSPIYEGLWLDTATAFLEQQRELLSQIPVAYFVVHARNNKSADEQQRHVQRCIKAIHDKVPEIEPVDVGVFAGAFNSRSWTLSTLLALKAQGDLPLDGDYRDWNAIQAWARQVLPLLTQKAAVRQH
ncbi:menaquinone-dependent protoporphyrinogen oxidase [Anaerolineae bacterium]|nr:menaquinone-dependent protoporphyrinogen oxidase [Anaerolineae bacterium]